MRFLSFLGLSLILFLSGCSLTAVDSAPPRYELPSKAGGRMCSFQCRNAFDHCSQACNLSERSCYNEAQSQAIKDYEAYVRDQFKAHAPTELRPRDFERLENCVATSCRMGCKKHYDSCFEECGGKIISESSCKYLCF